MNEYEVEYVEVRVVRLVVKASTGREAADKVRRPMVYPSGFVRNSVRRVTRVRE